MNSLIFPLKRTCKILKPSREQQAVVESSGNLLVNAIAGSGKTSTLIAYATKRPQRKMLYLAFNQSVKKEAGEKFRSVGLGNVRVETAHSLAFRALGGSRLSIAKNNYRAYDARLILGYKRKDAVEDMKFGRHVIGLVSAFCNSTARRVAEVDYISLLRGGSDRRFAEQNYDDLVFHARTFLGKMEQGEVDIEHDFYLKKYQLSSPDLGHYDHILFDEGQDASPVMLDVFLRQPVEKVIVGDEHQQIYSWRYAVNALKNTDFPRKYLETSYRFDRDVGQLARSVLNTKNILEPTRVPKITGRGGGEATGTTATLGRTNGAILIDAVDQLIDKKVIDSVYFEGHFNSYTYADEGGSVYDVLNLYMGNRRAVRDPMIKAFQDFSQLEEYAEDSGDAPLVGIIEIVKKYKGELPAIIAQIKEKHVAHGRKNEADMIYSTVHKAKGMEYNQVTLLGDFMSEQKLREYAERKDPDLNGKLLEDINILYVAVTRTKGKLIIPAKLVPDDFDADHCKSIEILEPPADEAEIPELQLAQKRTKDTDIDARERSRRVYKKSWAPGDDEQLEIMYCEGRSMKELMDHFGRSRGVITSRIKRLELQEKYE